MTEEQRIEKAAKAAYEEEANRNALIAKRIAFRVGLRYRKATWATASEDVKKLYRTRAARDKEVSRYA